MKEQWQQHSFIDEPQPVNPPRRQQLAAERQLRKAIERYVDVPTLRRYASEHEELAEALRTGDIPEELTWILSLLASVLAPIEREKIESPADIASYLQVRMGHECQEQFCVVCLNVKNRVQKVHTVYQGNVNTTIIRPAEVFREPVRLNSSGVIFAHQHPSGDPTPSPEDALVTRHLVAAGKVLDIDVHDHLVITPGEWVSLRERGLGFDKP